MADRLSERRHSSEQQIVHAKESPKVACVACRGRKLGCDRQRPSCGLCVRLQINCVYDAPLRKRGPKKGIVGILRKRLAHAEALLASNTRPETQPSVLPSNAGNCESLPNIDLEMVPEFQYSPMLANMKTYEEMPYQIPGEGPSKILLSQMTVDYLERVYFQKIHPMVPLIHVCRYKASTSQSPPLQPKLSLRYVMWALAASLCPQYQSLQEQLYRKARDLLLPSDLDCSEDRQIAVLQSWALLARYELLNMMSYRALLTTGRAVRMAQNMGLFRIDRPARQREICGLPETLDTIELEERRRVFWTVFYLDRILSIAKRLPVLIDEKDIATNLPMADELYQQGEQCIFPTPLGATVPEDMKSLSAFATSIIVLNYCASLLNQDQPLDSTAGIEKFWTRQQSLQATFTRLSAALAETSLSTSSISDPNLVLSRLILHLCCIYLHDRATWGPCGCSESPQCPAVTDSERFFAASQITDIITSVEHVDLRSVHAVLSFVLYEAARVFFQQAGRHLAAPAEPSLQFAIDTLRGLLPAGFSKNIFLQTLKAEFPKLNMGIWDSNTPNMELTPPQSRYSACLSLGRGSSQAIDLSMDDGPYFYNADIDHITSNYQAIMMGHGDHEGFGDIANPDCFTVPTEQLLDKLTMSILSPRLQHLQSAPSATPVHELDHNASTILDPVSSFDYGFDKSDDQLLPDSDYEC